MASLIHVFVCKGKQPAPRAYGFVTFGSFLASDQRFDPDLTYMELQMDYSQRTNAEVCDDYGNVGSSIQQEWYHGAQGRFFEKTNGFSFTS